MTGETDTDLDRWDRDKCWQMRWRHVLTDETRQKLTDDMETEVDRQRHMLTDDTETSFDRCWQMRLYRCWQMMQMLTDEVDETDENDETYVDRQYDIDVYRHMETVRQTRWDRWDRCWQTLYGNRWDIHDETDEIEANIQDRCWHMRQYSTVQMLTDEAIQYSTDVDRWGSTVQMLTDEAVQYSTDVDRWGSTVQYICWQMIQYSKDVDRWGSTVQYRCWQMRQYSTDDRCWQIIQYSTDDDRPDRTLQ